MNINENRSKGSRDMNGHETKGKSFDLEVCLHNLVIDSAFCLTERNIGVKLNENRSKDSGYIERTINSMVNPMTLTCDIDIDFKSR